MKAALKLKKLIVRIYLRIKRFIMRFVHLLRMILSVVLSPPFWIGTIVIALVVILVSTLSTVGVTNFEAHCPDGTPIPFGASLTSFCKPPEGEGRYSKETMSEGDRKLFHDKKSKIKNNVDYPQGGPDLGEKKPPKGKKAKSRDDDPYGISIEQKSKHKPWQDRGPHGITDDFRGRTVRDNTPEKRGEGDPDYGDTYLKVRPQLEDINGDNEMQNVGENNENNPNITSQAENTVNQVIRPNINEIKLVEGVGYIEIPDGSKVLTKTNSSHFIQNETEHFYQPDLSPERAKEVRRLVSTAKPKSGKDDTISYYPKVSQQEKINEMFSKGDMIVELNGEIYFNTRDYTYEQITAAAGDMIRKKSFDLLYKDIPKDATIEEVLRMILNKYSNNVSLHQVKYEKLASEMSFSSLTSLTQFAAYSIIKDRDTKTGNLRANTYPGAAGGPANCVQTPILTAALLGFNLDMVRLGALDGAKQFMGLGYKLDPNLGNIEVGDILYSDHHIMVAGGIDEKGNVLVYESSYAAPATNEENTVYYGYNTGNGWGTEKNTYELSYLTGSGYNLLKKPAEWKTVKWQDYFAKNAKELVEGAGGTWGQFEDEKEKKKPEKESPKPSKEDKKPKSSKKTDEPKKDKPSPSKAKPAEKPTEVKSPEAKATEAKTTEAKVTEAIPTEAAPTEAKGTNQEQNSQTLPFPRTREEFLAWQQQNAQNKTTGGTTDTIVHVPGT